MKSLFTFIILFFIAYYFVKAIFRLIAVFLNNDNSGNKNKWSNNKKGKVTIDYQEKQKKRFDKDKGDYIDYEEIK
jgi:hypothetical protein